MERILKCSLRREIHARTTRVGADLPQRRVLEERARPERQQRCRREERVVLAARVEAALQPAVDPRVASLEPDRKKNVF